jgi:methionine--tRNA ligase beta chain
MINFDDFAKIEMRVGKIISAEPIEGSEKLLKLQVDFGEEARQILSGIAKWYTPEELVNKSAVFVTNLEPRMMMGLESQGMLLAAEGTEKPILIQPAEIVTPGSKLG